MPTYRRQRSAATYIPLADLVVIGTDFTSYEALRKQVSNSSYPACCTTVGPGTLLLQSTCQPIRQVRRKQPDELPLLPRRCRVICFWYA